MTVLDPVISYLAGLSIGQRVTLKQIMDGADRPRKPVLRVMDRLVREGYLVEVDDNPAMKTAHQFGRDLRNPTWSIIKPPVARTATSHKYCTRDRIWKVIWNRKRFCMRELKRLAQAGESSCRDYIKLLQRAGYIRQIGKDCRQKVYVVMPKTPGPQRPKIKEKAEVNHD